MTIEDRPYQNRVADKLIASRGGIAKVPAGGGKTIIGAKALARWARLRAKLQKRQMVVRVIANTTDQVRQWEEAFQRIPEIAESCAVTMHCYQGAPSLAGADIALFDECHHIAAPEFAKIADGTPCVKWGFSATPERADYLADEVYRLIGPIVEEVDRKELLDAGKLAHARVIMHQPNQQDEFVDIIRQQSDKLAERWMFTLQQNAYNVLQLPIRLAASNRRVQDAQWIMEEAHRRKVNTNAPVMALSQKLAADPQAKRKLWELCKALARDEIESRARWIAAQDIGIFENQARNNRIVQIALNHSQDTVLGLIGKIAHGDALAKRIPGAVTIHSQMRKADCGMTRKTAILHLKTGHLRMVFATSLADEGLDVPHANVLILAAAGRSAAKAEQRTARVLRAFHDKTHGTIYDFMDVQHPFLLAQSKERVRLYRKLGYEVTFHREDAR